MEHLSPKLLLLESERKEREVLRLFLGIIISTKELRLSLGIIISAMGNMLSSACHA